MAKKRKFKISEAEKKASYAARAKKRAATMALSKSQAKRLAATKGKTVERLITHVDRKLRKVYFDGAENQASPFNPNGGAIPTPWTENERAMKRSADVAAVEAIVKNLADSYDLDMVLAAIRDKVQRLLDERGAEQGSRSESREALITLLGRCIRITRRFDSRDRAQMGDCATTAPAEP